MISSIQSMGFQGVTGYPVSVECYISGGLPAFDVVGLPDTAVKEARERVRAAIKNIGFSFPVSRMTVNLAPADTKKIGTLYDLPILLGILVAQGKLSVQSSETAFIGELSLAGELRPIRGALSMAISAAKNGIKEIYLPAANAAEAAFAENIKVYPVENVVQLMSHLIGEIPIKPAEQLEPKTYGAPEADFSDVRGLMAIKRALEVAAAGGHNILLVGPPGSGKSMLAKRLPSILPDMTKREMIESTQIHSVRGLTSPTAPVVSSRPFRSPHHSTSSVALAGGGSNLMPGEISLAHNGVLFLDELPEYRRDALEILRQPIEDGVISVSRAAGTVEYPSQFMLVCAMNPCKCGWHGADNMRCTCSEQAVKNYHSKISGPLLDRIDIIIKVPSLSFEELQKRQATESSAQIKERVNKARDVQNSRYEGKKISCNSQIGQKELRKYCELGEKEQAIFKLAFERLNLTARSHDRILRVARTIADLDNSEKIEVNHIAEALQYRREL